MFPIALDPLIAATAYLDRIPSSVRTLAAHRTDLEHGLVLFGWAAGGVVLALMLKTGFPGQIRRWVERWVAASWARSLLPIFAFVVAFDLASGAANLLAQALRPDGVDLAAQGRAALAALPLEALAGGLGLWLLLSVLKAFPRWGWAGLSALAAVAMFALVLIPPVTLTPAARHDTPATGAQAAGLLDFARKGGFQARTLYVFDGADPVAVDVEGLGPITHLAVSRAALLAPQPETYAAMGHLLGHYRHKDLWSLALLWSAVAAVFFFAASKVCRSSPGGGLNRLPLIGLIAWGVLIVSTPVVNVFDQVINYRADDDALSLTQDPDALCRWLIATEAASKADPSPVEALLFYDHPPLKARLIHALRWKAAHGGL